LQKSEQLVFQENLNFHMCGFLSTEPRDTYYTLEFRGKLYEEVQLVNVYEGQYISISTDRFVFEIHQVQFVEVSVS
jgi:hypothetical protein